MTARFVACQACARHVRQGDAACPFCGAAAPTAPPLRVITRRLSRAAMHAAGAAGAIISLSECTSGSGGGSEAAFYGAPCIDGSCNVVYDAAQEAQYDGSTASFYGAPPCAVEDCGVAPLPEAGPQADAGEDGSSGDAATGDGAISDGPTDAGSGG